jgi:hypothetical protein
VKPIPDAVANAMPEVCALFSEWIEASHEARAAIHQLKPHAAAAIKASQDKLNALISAKQAVLQMAGCVRRGANSSQPWQRSAVQRGSVPTILETAREHVIRAEQFVARQERLVESWRRQGWSTHRAAGTLLTLRAALQTFREHLAWEEERFHPVRERAKVNPSVPPRLE